MLPIRITSSIPTHRGFHSSCSTPQKRRSGDRFYHGALSSKSLDGLHCAKTTVVSQLGEESLSQLKQRPLLLRKAVAVEHVLGENKRHFMVQSTPKCMAFLAKALTTLGKFKNNHEAELPFMQLRHNPPAKCIKKLQKEIKKNGKNDLTPEMQRLLLSGNYGLFHNFNPKECALFYNLQGTAATPHETLRNIALRSFTTACEETGMHTGEIPTQTREFSRIFDLHAGLKMTTFLYVNFDLKDADSIGYNALPFGALHSTSKLSTVLKAINKGKTQFFDPHKGSDLQMRLVATSKVLDPKMVSVIDISDPEHLRKCGASNVLDSLHVPSRLGDVIGPFYQSEFEREENKRYGDILGQIETFKGSIASKF